VWPTTEWEDGDTFDPNDCGYGLVHKPSVMLVLDKSGSMVADPDGFWDHDQDPNTPVVTRWSSLHSVVSELTVGSNAVLDLGLVLFPANAATAKFDETACIVDAEPVVSIAEMNAANIVDALPDALADAKTMQGATPATRGLEVAIQAFAGVPAEQPMAMILVTDGVANCRAGAVDEQTLLEMYDDGVEAMVAAAAVMGIKTYVVGIGIAKENAVSGAEVDGVPDNVDTYEKLNALALAGGAAREGDEKFYGATDQLGLVAALEAISLELSCTITLTPTPKYPEYVEIEPYGNQHVEDCATEDGWTFLPQIESNEPLRIALCGKACLDYRMSGVIDIKHGCAHDE